MHRSLFMIAACAGLLGAAGVAAAAAAAHLGNRQLLETAASFLMIHSAAVFGTVALGLRAPPRTAVAFLVAALLLIAGMILFCGDFAVRALVSHSLFPMAAPTGGLLLIAGWVAAAIAAALAAGFQGRDGREKVGPALA
jgi:uncharacterized membrane protein YgdD (TMEM256/DUF423 family)